MLHPRTLEGAAGARARFDGRDVINLASNNYLGLADHPRVNEAASKAALELGAGSGAVRTIAGTMTLHRELERRFADFKHADEALMFQSGFTANAGTVAAILSKEDVIVSDQLNHASIIDGARLSRAEIKVFPHKDAEAADALLAETARPGRRQLLITDGVFSMDGDIAPLPELVEVAEKHGAIMMIDDAHATGVLGAGGAGTVDHFGLHGRVDIQVGTLSKAIGVLGGFIAGPHHLIEWLENRGRPFLFSTSAPPSVVAACIAALDVIHDEPDRLERLWSNTAMFKEGLHALGFDTGASRDADHAGDHGRRGEDADAGAPAVRGGRVLPRHRVPDRGRGQGAGADDRDRRPHRGRPPRGGRRVRARRTRAGAHPVTDGDGPRSLAALLGSQRVLPLVEVDDDASAVALARVLVDGGLPVIEIALRTPGASRRSRPCGRRCRTRSWAPGTVMGSGQLFDAIGAGAAFAVSPGSSEALLNAAAAGPVPFVPGVATVTELMRVVSSGVREVKFFPAEASGGIAALTSLAAVEPSVRFLPTGGIDADLAPALPVRSEHVFAVGGSWVCPPALIRDGAWDRIAERARAASWLSRPRGRDARLDRRRAARRAAGGSAGNDPTGVRG